VFEELEKFGKIDELNVCANLGDHMIGNVYVKYEEEEQAEKALNALNGRFYAGRLIMAEYSPVTDFRECCCLVLYSLMTRVSWHACPVCEMEMVCQGLAWFDRCVHDCARDKAPIDAFLYGVLSMVCFLCSAGESRCRQYEESSCKYGGHCNFMHIKRPSRDVCKRLGIRTTYEAARGGGGGPGGGGGGGEARHTFTNAFAKHLVWAHVCFVRFVVCSVWRL